MNTKKIILYEKYFEYAKMLTDAEFGSVVLFLGRRFFMEEDVDISGLSPAAQMLYNLMCTEIKANFDKYEKVCEKRRIASLKY